MPVLYNRLQGENRSNIFLFFQFVLVVFQEVDEDQKATDLCLPHPPEIKDHNYSFVKSGPRVSVNECVRVIDGKSESQQGGVGTQTPEPSCSKVY